MSTDYVFWNQKRNQTFGASGPRGATRAGTGLTAGELLAPGEDNDLRLRALAYLMLYKWWGETVVLVDVGTIDGAEDVTDSALESYARHLERKAGT